MSSIDKSLALELVKQRICISTTVRDTYLAAIIDSVVAELEDEKGIALSGDNSNHLLFVCDYATWRYQSRDESGAMPRHLQFRMHNLLLHNGGGRS